MNEIEVVEIARQYIADNKAEVYERFVGEEGIGIGEVFNIRRVPACERAAEDVQKGDRWAVCFKIDTPEGVVIAPNHVIVRVEDSTGEASVVIMP